MVQHSVETCNLSHLSFYSDAIGTKGYLLFWTVYGATTWLCEMIVIRRNTIPTQDNGLIASVLPAYFAEVCVIHYLSATCSYPQTWRESQSSCVTKNRGIIDGLATTSRTLCRNRQPFPVEH